MHSLILLRGRKLIVNLAQDTLRSFHSVAEKCAGEQIKLVLNTLREDAGWGTLCDVLFKELAAWKDKQTGALGDRQTDRRAVGQQQELNKINYTWKAKVSLDQVVAFWLLNAGSGVGFGVESLSLPSSVI